MQDILELGRQVLAAQPFSVLLGAELMALSTSGAEPRVPIRADLQQQHVHGGVISSLADNALTFAGGGALGPSVVTSEFKITYIRPAIGHSLVARATVLHAARRQAACRCEVFVVTAAVKRCAPLRRALSRCWSRKRGADGRAPGRDSREFVRIMEGRSVCSACTQRVPVETVQAISSLGLRLEYLLRRKLRAH
jgi:uncharacterized protein (TIGR00369 family)